MFRNIIIAISLAHASVASGAVSLDHLVERILERHPALVAEESEVAAAEAGRLQAGLRPPPEVGVSAGFKDTDTDSGYEASAEWLFTMPRGGRLDALSALAAGEVDFARAGLERTRQELAREIRLLAYRYLAASADAAVAGEIADRSKAMIELLKQRPSAGPALLLELRVIEASLVEFQEAARTFTAQRDLARLKLNLWLGHEPQAPLDLNEPLQCPDDRFEYEALVRMLERSPAVLLRLADRTRAEAEVQLAAHEAAPEYQWGPYIAREAAGEAETVVGLAFSTPLGGGKRSEAATARARARQAAADAGLEQERLEARVELAGILKQYEGALAKVAGIPQDLVDQMRAAADLADRQYRLGAIPVQLFLDVQREFLSVQQLHHQALLEAWSHAVELRGLADAAGRAQP